MNPIRTFLGACLALAVTTSASALPFMLSAETTEITGVLITSRTGPADNFDIVTNPGSRSEGTTRLHFQGPLDMKLLELVQAMSLYAVDPEPERSTTYPGVARIKAKGHTEEGPDGKRFVVTAIEVVEEPGPGSDAQAMAAFEEEFLRMQKAIVHGSEPEVVEAFRVLEEAGVVENVAKLGAQIARVIFAKPPPPPAP